MKNAKLMNKSVMSRLMGMGFQFESNGNLTREENGTLIRVYQPNEMGKVKYTISTTGEVNDKEVINAITPRQEYKVATKVCYARRTPHQLNKEVERFRKANPNASVYQCAKEIKSEYNAVKRRWDKPFISKYSFKDDIISK